MDRSRALRAKRTDPSEPRSYRLANSVRLPWAIGLAAFLLLALGGGILSGRGSQEEFEVPAVLLDYQQSIANDAAQSVRRGVNEGVDDLTEIAVVLETSSGTTPGALQDALASVGELHGRYTSLAIIDAERKVVAKVGAEPDLSVLEPEPPYRDPGMSDAVLDGSGEGLLIPQFSPLEVSGERWTIVGFYDPEFLRFPLEGALPGEAWVVNRDGRIVGGVATAPPLGTLPRSALREAASKAVAGNSGAFSGGGSLDSQELVSYAPIAGIGPSGQLGWGVVTTRSAQTFSLPATDAERQGMLLSIVTGILALIVFAWLYIVILRPIFLLQKEAERLAFGDLSKTVEVVRYDEIGLVARALERIRILLIKKRVQKPTEKK